MAKLDPIDRLRDRDYVRGLRFCVISHGCKVNRVEADTLAAELVNRGGVLGDIEEAKLVIVNSCTVTGEADKKARKAVRHALKISPDADLIVTGCGVAIDPSSYEAIDERVRAVDRFELLEAVRRDDCAGSDVASVLRLGEGFRTRVNLKIQDGCNHACTYCIVHIARGKAHSVPAEDVLAETSAYLSQGVKEIVLTGIDLGSYRSGDIRLARLVGEILVQGKASCPDGELPARVRASSLEPMTIEPDFIELMAQSQGRVCRHLHVPVQSGSSKVLREMARPYTAEVFRDLVERLYGSIPQLALTTDIIVGFPGETDDDFACTLELARACRFSKIHVFPYSRRVGTPAAERKDQVPPEVINERAARLRALSDEMRGNDFASRRGSVELALVETTCALTESYHEIPIPPGAVEGSLIPITIS